MKVRKTSISNLDDIQKYQLIIETSNEGIYILNDEGIIIFGNDRFYEIIGRRKTDLIGKHYHKLLFKEDIPFFESKIAERRLGTKDTYEWKFKNKSNKAVWCLISATPIFDNDNIFIGSFAMVNDITVSKLNELALIEREKKLRLLADNSSEAIGIYSVDGTCKYMTPSLKKVFGYSPREIVGHKYTMLFNVVPPEDCNELKRGFNLNILKRETVIAAFRIRHKNGNYIWCQTSFTLVFDEDEEQNYILSVSSNVTEQITAKSELEKYRLHLEDLIKERTLELEKINVLLEDELKKQKEAEEKVKTALVKEKELNELKSNFITMVSHEFRTPLTSILSSAELIQRYRKRWTVEKTDEHLDQILDSIEYLNHMLDGVLTISRVESGKLSFSPQPVNLYQMCLDSISEVKHLAGSKHKIVFQYQLEMHIFILDPTLVHFILSNLLSNALKYSPGGGKVILGLSGYEEFIKITIQDYGIGMTDEYKRHCFESFVRGSNTAEIDGTGLGLSIVKKSVELHNGEIIYSSELGSGTVFIIKIPMVKI